MSKLTTILLLFIFSSCTPTIIPLKGEYPQAPMVFNSPQSFEKTWDRLIDVFAQKGLAIKIIDKSSGLIVSDNSRMPATTEDKDGHPVIPNAFVVVPKRKFGAMSRAVSGQIGDAYNSKTIRFNDVYGEWNVRVKPNGTGSTINVNITNVTYDDYGSSSKLSTRTSLNGYQSTGVFEKMLADLIK